MKKILLSAFAAITMLATTTVPMDAATHTKRVKHHSRHKTAKRVGVGAAGGAAIGALAGGGTGAAAGAAAGAGAGALYDHHQKAHGK
jgi:outer membrane lipoprotein SlyB